MIALTIIHSGIWKELTQNWEAQSPSCISTAPPAWVSERISFMWLSDCFCVVGCPNVTWQKRQAVKLLHEHNHLVSRGKCSFPQMQQRKYYRKLTLQGNVYPMPTMAFLQDKNKRVSILSSQASGVANLVPGKCYNWSVMVNQIDYLW